MSLTAERAGVLLPDAVERRPGTLRAHTDPTRVRIPARRRTATIAGLATLAAVTALLVALTVRANGGVFTYVLDDPYIHLAMARNLAQHGTYGLAPGAYESASSSPGWVALLALLIRAAPAAAEWYPLALNVLAAGAVLVLVLRAQDWLYRVEPAPLRAFAYVALPLLLFLPALVLVGMEHSLHALLAVALLLMLGRALRRRLSGGELAGVAALALLAGAIRYETLFLAGGCATALVLAPAAAGLPRRLLGRLRRPAVWAFLLPPVAVTVALGLVNLHNGQLLLPNSVLAKSGLGQGAGLSALVPSLNLVPAMLGSDLQMLALILCAVTYLAVRRLRCEQSGLWLAWLVTTALHLLFARFGWYDRYQAYLVVTGTILLLRSLPEVSTAGRRRGALLVLALLAVALPFPKYGEEAAVPVAAHGIEVHNAELGRFLAAAYPERAVMVNDIGEVSWLHGGTLVDLWALGSYDVLRAYRDGSMGRGFVTALAARDGAQVAAVYSSLQPLLPAGWAEVARWVPAGGAAPTAAGDELAFYAPRGGPAAALRQAMQGFAPSLPPDVHVVWGGGPAA